MQVLCRHCGRETFTSHLGRRRKYCSAACRYKAHHRARQRLSSTTKRRDTPSAVPPAAEAGDMATWAAWVRLTVRRRCDGRAVVAADPRHGHAVSAGTPGARYGGIDDDDGRGAVSWRGPEIAVERDARTALQRLMGRLDLEDSDETEAPSAGGEAPAICAAALTRSRCRWTWCSTARGRGWPTLTLIAPGWRFGGTCLRRCSARPSIRASAICSMRRARPSGWWRERSGCASGFAAIRA